MLRNQKKIRRIILEVAFIIFLFYANLLMGEYNRNGYGQKNGIIYALHDIFTLSNFSIAVVLALVGHLIFDHLRNGHS